MGETDRPAASEERVLLGVTQLVIAGLREHGLGIVDRRGQVFAERGTEQGEGRRGEARLHHGLLVRERQQHRIVDERRERRRRVADDTDRADASLDAVDELEHLAGRAGSCQRDDGVVSPVDERLGSGERIRLAVPRGLAESGVRLRHEPRRAAADDRDPRTGGGEQALLGREVGSPCPHCWLGVEFFAHVRAGKRFSHRGAFLARRCILVIV